MAGARVVNPDAGPSEAAKGRFPMLQRTPLNTTSPREVKNGDGGRRRRRHPQVRNGQRLAALRAMHAERSYLEKPGWELTMAATSCNAGIRYVMAMCSSTSTGIPS